MTAAISPTASPVEYVLALPVEDQEAVLDALFRKFLTVHPSAGTIPVRSTNGEWLGNFVRPGEPASAADRVFAELAPPMRQALMQPYLDLDLDNVLSDEQLEAITAGELPKPR